MGKIIFTLMWSTDEPVLIKHGGIKDYILDFISFDQDVIENYGLVVSAHDPKEAMLRTIFEKQKYRNYLGETSIPVTPETGDACIVRPRYNGGQFPKRMCFQWNLVKADWIDTANHLILPPQLTVVT
jgi:hypothetical protein